MADASVSKTGGLNARVGSTPTFGTNNLRRPTGRRAPPTPGMTDTFSSFEARIRTQGPNPYVDVPPRVAETHEEFSQSGRIPVEGFLNETPFRATLIPIGKDRHRLYVNGGMRSAAAVGVGDTVAVRLRGVPLGEVNAPADVAARIAQDRGAAAAFDALSPSHRRELLRYIDDARSPATRRKRVQATIDGLLGRETSAPARAPTHRDPWTCPDCGKEFVNRNQFHSCHRVELDDLFADKPAHIRVLFDRLSAIIQALGPVTVVPSRDLIAFMVRVRFVSAVPRKRWLDVGLWLPHRVEDSRFHKVETVVLNAHIHMLRLTEASQLDDEAVHRWLGDAYAVGKQDHLRPASS